MRLTIVKDDGVVGIDGVFRKIDLSTLDSSIRAVQWNGESGEIEFYGDNEANEPFTDLAPFENWVTAWQNHPLQFPNEPAPDPRLGMVVSRFQALAAMLNAGLLATAQAHFADPATSELDRLAWDNATSFYRLSPLVEATGTALGLTPEQLDALFTQAASIQI